MICTPLKVDVSLPTCVFEISRHQFIKSFELDTLIIYLLWI